MNTNLLLNVYLFSWQSAWSMRLTLPARNVISNFFFYIIFIFEKKVIYHLQSSKSKKQANKYLGMRTYNKFMNCFLWIVGFFHAARS